MKFYILYLISFIFLFTSYSIAGCPAMGIDHANTKVLNCSYHDSKAIGAAMDVIINYSNERFMGKPSAKDMKAKIFYYSTDKDACKKFMKGKTFCMNLKQWCVMSGPEPHGASFSVASMRDGKCVVTSDFHRKEDDPNNGNPMIK